MKLFEILRLIISGTLFRCSYFEKVALNHQTSYDMIAAVHVLIVI